MFSKVLVKLTGIFLFSSCISATPATLPGQPGEAQNINGDINARAYQPYQCEDNYRWIRRECVPENGPSAWQDVCVTNTFGTVYDYKPGTCEEGTICLNGFNSDGFRFISCISAEELASTKKGRKRKADPQAGKSGTQRGRTEIGNSQQKFSVTIDHDMTGAAVDAVFESKCRTLMFIVICSLLTWCIGNQLLNLGNDGSFIIAPNNVIVGNVHGYQENVCHGNKNNPATARDCYPIGTYDFKAGQTIDFTWGMSADQEGILAYAIVPAQSVTG